MRRKSICTCAGKLHPDACMAAQCVVNGAVAVLVTKDVDHDIPEDVPVIMVDSTLRALGALASAFYDRWPAGRQETVSPMGVAHAVCIHVHRISC